MSTTHLLSHCSDHAPLHDHINPLIGFGSSFRFLNAWTKNPSFIDRVREVWDTKIRMRPLKKFGEKLKLLKVKLREWNKETFGNIGMAIKIAEEEVLKWET